MRIINEIKKLFTIKSLIILGLISFIIWNLCIEFRLEYFPNGYPETTDLRVSEHLLEKYGTTLDDDELEDFKEETSLLEKDADEYLLNDKDAQALGIKSYKEFKKASDEDMGKDERISNLRSKIMFEGNGYLFWELGSRERVLDQYSKDIGYNFSLEGKEKERANEIQKSDQAMSVLDECVIDNYKELMYYFLLLVVITVAFVISPIFLRDNKNKVNFLQYSSITGRGLAKKKVIAAMITTFLMTTIELIILFGFYVQNNTLKFWECSINSKLNWGIYWFDLTFGEYVIISIILMYMIAFLVASISLFVSTKVKNYVALIGVQIPVLFVLISFIRNYDLYSMTTIGYPKYTVIFGQSILMIVAIILLLLVLKQEKRRDILN
ncbi:hypothetical protein [Clostridium sp. B9]|uniref:hypothetical protein n=1 Tax=Clostridium sp. B9 TaxID=3423224 RepID=UPI003D2EFEC0